MSEVHTVNVTVSIDGSDFEVKLWLDENLELHQEIFGSGNITDIPPVVMARIDGFLTDLKKGLRGE